MEALPWRGKRSVVDSSLLYREADSVGHQLGMELMKSSIQDMAMLRASLTRNEPNLNVPGAYQLLVAMDRAVVAADCEVRVHFMAKAPGMTK